MWINLFNKWCLSFGNWGPGQLAQSWIYPSWVRWNHFGVWISFSDYIKVVTKLSNNFPSSGILHWSLSNTFLTNKWNVGISGNGDISINVAVRLGNEGFSTRLWLKVDLSWNLDSLQRQSTAILALIGNRIFCYLCRWLSVEIGVSKEF
jgi:hypothetical protein